MHFLITSPLLFGKTVKVCCRHQVSGIRCCKSVNLSLIYGVRGTAQDALCAARVWFPFIQLGGSYCAGCRTCGRARGSGSGEAPRGAGPAWRPRSGELTCWASGVWLGQDQGAGGSGGGVCHLHRGRSVNQSLSRGPRTRTRVCDQQKAPTGAGGYSSKHAPASLCDYDVDVFPRRPSA